MNGQFCLTLVRHAETLENRESIIQGQANTVLSDLGRKQAALVGTRLQYEKFTHMFSSDLSRAADTAQAIVAANQVSKCQLVLDKRLRERSFGIMQGKKFSELQNMIKEKNIPFKTYTPDEGESIEQVTERATIFFNDICNQAHQCGPLSDQCTSASGSSIEEKNVNSITQEVHPISATVETNGASSNSSLDVQLESNTNMDDKSSEFGVISILIVSHGLFLKELKRIILNKYRGKLRDDVAFLANRVSPNTGVSKFIMSASEECDQLKVRCPECCFIDCNSHLLSSEVADAEY